MSEAAVVRVIDMNNASPLKAGTQIACANGHICCVVTEDIEVGDLDYVRKFEWKQHPPRIPAPFPIRCDLCDAVVFDATPPHR